MQTHIYARSFITLLLDRVGRKRPLLFGAGSLVLLFSALAAIIASFPPATSPNDSAQRAGIAMIFLMSIVFSLSFGPVSWVLASEVFPTRTRSIGTAVATCSNWALNVLLSEVSPIAMANIGWKFYMLFVALNTVDFFAILFFFPETKGLCSAVRKECFLSLTRSSTGKTLEQMAEVFGDQVNSADLNAKYGDGHLSDVKNGSSLDEKQNVEYA